MIIAMDRKAENDQENADSPNNKLFSGNVNVDECISYVAKVTGQENSNLLIHKDFIPEQMRGWQVEPSNSLVILYSLVTRHSKSLNKSDKDAAEVGKLIVLPEGSTTSFGRKLIGMRGAKIVSI